MAIVGICALVYLANLGSLQIGQGVDDAVYLSVARSLAAGLGYVRYEDPRHPVEHQYPPALPALEALVLRLGGSIQAVRLIPLTFTLVALLLADAYFRSRLRCAGADPDGPWRWILLALFGLNHLIVGFAGIPMTEAPFICMTLAALLILTPRADATDSPWGFGRITGLALVLAVGCLFRSAGFAVVLGSAAWLFIRGRKRAAVGVAALTGTLLAPWLIYQRQITGSWFGAGYALDIASPGDVGAPFLLRPLANLLTYASSLVPQAILPIFGERVEALLARFSAEPLAGVLGVAVTVAVIAGGVICARRRSLPDGWIAVVMMLVLLSWPFRYTRFVLPLLPILLVYLLALGIRVTSVRGTALYAVAALLIAGFLARDALMVVRPPAGRYPDVRETGEFIATHTEPDALVIAANAAGIAPHARRDAIAPRPLKIGEPESTAAAINQALEARPVYLLSREGSPSQEDLAELGVRHFTMQTVAEGFVPGVSLHRLRPSEGQAGATEATALSAAPSHQP